MQYLTEQNYQLNSILITNHMYLIIYSNTNKQIRWSTFGPFKSQETLTFSEINMVKDEDDETITFITKDLYFFFLFYLFLSK